MEEKHNSTLLHYALRVKVSNKILDFLTSYPYDENTKSSNNASANSLTSNSSKSNSSKAQSGGGPLQKTRKQFSGRNSKIPHTIHKTLKSVMKSYSRRKPVEKN